MRSHSRPPRVKRETENPLCGTTNDGLPVVLPATFNAFALVCCACAKSAHEQARARALSYDHKSIERMHKSDNLTVISCRRRERTVWRRRRPCFTQTAAHNASACAVRCIRTICNQTCRYNKVYTYIVYICDASGARRRAHNERQPQEARVRVIACVRV